MFKRAFRLPVRAQFIRPRFITAEFVTIKLAQNILKHNRFGFVISKKVAKSAVERNRSKRKIRACMEVLHDQLKTGNDYLLIIKKNVADVPTQELLQEIKALLQKAGLCI